MAARSGGSSRAVVRPVARAGARRASGSSGFMAPRSGPPSPGHQVPVPGCAPWDHGGTPCGRRRGGGRSQPFASVASRPTASCSTSSRLQNANRTSVRAASTSSWNTDTGTPTTPHSDGRRRQNVQRVGHPERRRVGDDEVGPGRPRHLQTARLQPLAEQVALGLQRRRQPVVDLVAEAERHRDRRLERAAGHVGEELLDRPDRRHRRLRAVHPADLPPGRREGLAGRGDGDGALRHTGQGGDGDVLGAVEDQVLVDLVGDHPRVVLARQRADQLELGAAEDLAGGVVRGVEQHQPGAGGERRPERRPRRR